MDTSAKPWEALHDTGAVDIAAGVVEMLGRLWLAEPAGAVQPGRPEGDIPHGEVSL